MVARAAASITLGTVLIAAPTATVVQPPSAGQQLSAEVVLTRAGEYVARFTEAFSNVVGEERYTQEVSGSGATTGGRAGRRELRSDVVLLKIGGPLEWRPYRDVFDVDGKPVHDRDDRLMTLFEHPSPTSFEQAARIAQESARFNIGLPGRTINTPLLALLFLQRSIQPRFRFKLGKADTSIGPRVWVVDYREEKRPTLIRGIMTADSTDLPASGRFWLDLDTGRVAKAELLFAVVGMRASLVTSFRRDERIGIDVPVEMREVYRLQRTVTGMGETHKDEGAPVVTNSIEETVITGVASYSNFRRFEVTADSNIAPAKP